MIHQFYEWSWFSVTFRHKKCEIHPTIFLSFHTIKSDGELLYFCQRSQPHSIKQGTKTQLWGTAVQSESLSLPAQLLPLPAPALPAPSQPTGCARLCCTPETCPNALPLLTSRLHLCQSLQWPLSAHPSTATQVGTQHYKPDRVPASQIYYFPFRCPPRGCHVGIWEICGPSWWSQGTTAP